MTIKEFDFSDGIERRPEMEWNTAYPRTDPSSCTYCGTDSIKRLDNTVTKLPWANRPLGQVVTRCPEHQSRAGQAARLGET